MDPVTMIVSALAMGAIAGAPSVGAQAIKDAYAGLTTLIVRRFGNKPDAQKAVEDLEKKPESAGRKATAEEELKEAGAGDDAEIVAAAQTLMKALKDHGVAGAQSFTAHAEGGSTLVQGNDNSVATGGSVIAKGKVKGDINTSGSSKS